MKRLIFLLMLAYSLNMQADNSDDATPLYTNSYSDFLYNKKMMEGKVHAGIYASYLTMPLDWKDKGAFAGGLQIDYFISNTTSLGFRFSIARKTLSSTDQQQFIDKMTEEFDEAVRRQKIPDTAQITGLTGYGLYVPVEIFTRVILPSAAQKRVRPYAGIGLNFSVINQYSNPVYNVPMNIYIERIEADAEISTTAIAVGLVPEIGLLFNIDELWNIDLNAKYNLLFGSDFKSSFSVNFGLVFNLSPKY